jgi:23S rRNA-/tRNA-specific pseudouridylate synthase
MATAWRTKIILQKFSFQIPLEGKLTETEYTAGDYDPTSNTTKVDVIIRTGRKHRIRRHFEMIGFPVMVILVEVRATKTLGA